MKRIQRNFLFFLFFSLMLTACNEKEEEDTEEKIACLTITEATGSGEERVTTEQKFIYEDGKLTRHITKQTYTDRLLEGEYTHSVSSQISYEPGKVIVTDETGTVSTYQIDEKGYATMCTRKEPGGKIRTYTFSYSTTGDENLTGVKESIDGSPYSEISMRVVPAYPMRKASYHACSSQSATLSLSIQKLSMPTYSELLFPFFRVS